MTITVLDGHTLNPGDNPWTPVESLGEFIVYDRTPNDEILDRAAGAEAILTNKTPLTSHTLSELPRLRYIGVLATGYNVVDVGAARDRGIPVTNVPVYGTDSVAEYVFTLLTQRFRRSEYHCGLVLNGEWAASPDFTFWRTPMVELAGKTIGVVGFGRIGRRVGEIASAFHMKVLAHDTFRGNEPAYDFEWCEVDELFSRSDVVSLHCNLTPENTGMVNATLLNRMKRDAYLLNTARGALVVEQDLAEALRSGTIGGAALDVVSTEPIRSDNPLLSAPNATITPHIAWATLEARRRLMQTAADNLAAFQAGCPVNVVNEAG